MNKTILVLFTLVLIGCAVKPYSEISMDNLKESFNSKDESEYMRQFPKEMEVFKSYFGWNEVLNEPEELYEESYAYIDYWFDLLNKQKFSNHDEQIVQICEDGEWQADGVNYFQDKSIEYIKNKRKYHLINDLSDTTAKSVLFFLFDSPHPERDSAFARSLSSEKRMLLDELFFKHFEEVETMESWKYYSVDDAYFIKEIDVNGDDMIDKVVSHKPYRGDQLLVFLNKNNTFKLSLESTNFSEDGGNQIVDIVKSKEGFMISTAFMDGGLYKIVHHVSLVNGSWTLNRSVFRTASGNEENADVYVCTVEQNVDMNDPDLFLKMKQIPDEEKRKKVCSTEKRQKKP